MAIKKYLNFSPHSRLATAFLGNYKSTFKGSGITFSDIRQYVPGDPYQRIDRKTSAKKGEWYLKEFEEERLLNILVVIDIGKDMHFHTIQSTKLDHSLQLAELLQQATREAGDRLGFFTYREQPVRYQKASKSTKQLQQLKKVVTTEKTAEKSDLSAAIDYLEHHHLKHHLILRVSDQLVTKEHKKLHGLARTNDLIRLHLFDPFEVTGTLPAGTSKELLISDTRSVLPVFLDQRAQYTYTTQFHQAIEESAYLLRSRNITHHMMHTDQDLLEQLILVFHKHKQYKQRH